MPILIALSLFIQSLEFLVLSEYFIDVKFVFLFEWHFFIFLRSRILSILRTKIILYKALIYRWLLNEYIRPQSMVFFIHLENSTFQRLIRGRTKLEAHQWLLFLLLIGCFQGKRVYFLLLQIKKSFLRIHGRIST